MITVSIHIAILTHVLACFLGGLAVHLLHKRGSSRISFFQAVVAFIVSTFWIISMYKQLLLDGEPTSIYLYAMFGLVQGSAFDISIEKFGEFLKNFRK